MDALGRVKDDIARLKKQSGIELGAMQERRLLFEDSVIDTPKTEGIKYAGSKLKLLPHILAMSGKTEARSIFDGFSGSTRVSQAFAQSGYQVISNDIAEWSKIFGISYLKNRKAPSDYQELIDHLNAIPSTDGWFTENYGGDVEENFLHNGIQKDGRKKPWQRKNTRKLDAIREEIDRLNLDEVSKCVALTSLMLGLDQVENTLGHFVSYLKDWSPRSFKDLELRVPRLWKNARDHSVLMGDVFDSLPDVEADLAYYDPPYGSNNEKMPPSRVRYASYYHIWTTICKNDKPRLFGKSLRREDTSDKAGISVFEEFRRNGAGQFVVVEAIESLIRETRCEWIVLSYSSGGRATASELDAVIRDNGKLIDTVKIDYQRNVMGTMTWTHQWTGDAEKPNQEFLFLIQK